jgi:hypothetical protein
VILCDVFVTTTKSTERFTERQMHIDADFVRFEVVCILVNCLKPIV